MSDSSEPPSLRELAAHTVTEVREHELEVLFVPSFHIPSRPPRLTWRVKLYWRLRRLIDWIHP